MSEISGKSIKRIRQIIIAAKNGNAPLNTSHIGTSSLSNPPTENTTMPNGGLSCPNNTVTTDNTPTQTRSKPNPLSMGVTIGIIINSIDIISRKNPRMINTINNITRTAQLLIASAETISTSLKGRVLRANMQLKIVAPITIIKTMPEVLIVLTSALTNLFQVRRLDAKPKMKATNAPIAPASVGVQKPPYNPPRLQ